jgi:RimJ/RimL family protein N-acetyltransferase
MSSIRLTTPHLELIGCTRALLEAEGDDRAEFAELLAAKVPGDWPPELYDDDARRWVLRALEEQPGQDGWWMYYLVERGEGGERTAVGVAGYKGPPANGCAELGYGVLADYRRRGYASEAVQALLQRAFGIPGVERMTAETYPHLVPSIGVLVKTGFRFDGDGSEEGVVRYALSREEWESAAAGNGAGSGPGRPAGPRAGGPGTPPAGTPSVSRPVGGCA